MACRFARPLVVKSSTRGCALAEPQKQPPIGVAWVNRPLLPCRRHLQPYLRRIDQARYYSNFGPLSAEFEGRLAEHAGIPAGSVVCLANGTQALLLALAAQDPIQGSLCVMPSWTFSATAHAIRQAGLIPYFVDVDETSWSLTPEIALQALEVAPGRVGAVVTVCPFGAPPQVEAWDRFREQTGVPVAIDAAASFDSMAAGMTPTMVSLHATKVLGVGEGGLVCSVDPDLIERIRRMSNFGFEASREITVAATNAKMSEYTAAVGCAALDLWTQTRLRHMRLTRRYVSAVESLRWLRPSPGWGQGWVAANLVVDFRGSGLTSSDLRKLLDERSVSTRAWWGRGCHHELAFCGFPRTTLPITETLGVSTIGLPYHLDLSSSDIAYIADALEDAYRQALDGGRLVGTTTSANVIQ